MRLTAAQSRLVNLMRSGRTLDWNGDAGPELSGYPFWPQKRTVRRCSKPASWYGENTATWRSR